MKIKRVVANNKRKEFILQNSKKTNFSFPYALLKIKPTINDPVVNVYVDKDTGGEAFCYELKSGKSETIHSDEVLDFNKDPDYLRAILLYNLTIEAQELLEQSNFSKRLLARRLDTSPTQLYRLLDQTYYGKTIDQMVRLLAVLGKTVEFNLVNNAA